VQTTLIHCIEGEIERLIEEHKLANEAMPQELYLQIDEAPDNAAYAELASLEHLVAADLEEVSHSSTIHQPFLITFFSFLSLSSTYCCFARLSRPSTHVMYLFPDVKYFFPSTLGLMFLCLTWEQDRVHTSMYQPPMTMTMTTMTLTTTMMCQI